MQEKPEARIVGQGEHRSKPIDLFRRFTEEIIPLTPFADHKMYDDQRFRTTLNAQLHDTHIARKFADFDNDSYSKLTDLITTFMNSEDPLQQEQGRWLIEKMFGQFAQAYQFMGDKTIHLNQIETLGRECDDKRGISAGGASELYSKEQLALDKADERPENLFAKAASLHSETENIRHLNQTSGRDRAIIYDSDQVWNAVASTQGVEYKKPIKGTYSFRTTVGKELKGNIAFSQQGIVTTLDLPFITEENDQLKELPGEKELHTYREQIENKKRT